MTTLSLADQGDALRDNYRAQLDAIRQDTRLSEDGKRAALASLWLDYSAERQRIDQEDAQRRAQEIERLEGRIFRPGGDAIDPTERAARQMAYRDAQRHADELSDDDAGTAAMHRAIRSGDTDLAHAILSVALDRGWPTTANRYLETHPTTAGDLEQLWQLRRQDTDMKFIVQRALRSGIESRPDELAPFREDQLAQVAEGALTADGAWGAPLQQ
jgi:hypothetical protein